MGTWVSEMEIRGSSPVAHHPITSFPKAALSQLKKIGGIMLTYYRCS
jgi:hypothetical protein